MVVITGIQGSGNISTKSFANDLQKDGNIMASDLICEFKQLYWVPSEKIISIYVIDDIFYEIQLKEVNMKKSIVA